MADTGKQILDGSSFTAWDNSFSSLATFRQYLDVLNNYRTDLGLCGVDFTSLPGADKDGKYWDSEYHKEDDINLKAFRDDADALRTAGHEATAQLDLIRQTENLPDIWKDDAGRVALDNYLTNSARMEQDRDHLIAHANEVAQVADNLEHTLKLKAQAVQEAVGDLVNVALRNNLSDFENRLRTGIESMKANNQGGSGPFGLGFNQHRYEPHGSGSGGNWSAADVRKDIQNSVIGGFGWAFNALDKSNYATQENVRKNYDLLLKALDVQGGPPGAHTPSDPATKKLTPEEQEQVAHWSQYSLTEGGGDCSRWAVASALANKYGTRDGPNGKEIDLPQGIQNAMMGGMPLHFPPTQTEINQITKKQGVTPVAPGAENDGLPGGPDLMSSQLNDFGLTSTAHVSNDVPGLVDQLTADLQAGHSAIVNGAPQPGGGHFLSVTGITTGPNGETMYLVNDSNRVSNGSTNSGTIPYPCTRQQLETFLQNRVSAGTPGYSTVE